MSRPQQIHRLASNSSEATPRQVIVLDTETRWRSTVGEEIHHLRLWEASSWYRHPKYFGRGRRQDAGGTTVAELVAFLNRVVLTTPTAWLYAHNAAFDLAVTNLPDALESAGWSLGQHNLASDNPWGHFKRGRRSLYLVDSHSLLPAPLERIGAALGLHKPDLPANEDDMGAWRARCRADVDITMRAILQFMNWWDAHHLGFLSVTGPRSGYNMMRHRCIPRQDYKPPIPRGPGSGDWVQHGHGYPVINPDPVARAQERYTLYQGRREAYQLGELPAGTYVEIDMRQAHLSVAGGWPLPCRRGTDFQQLDVDSPLIDSMNMGVIADVVLETDVADYPMRTAHGICYPVGTFRTRLAGPEIAAARRAGHLMQVQAGYYHRLSWWMQPWADQIGEILSDTGAMHPPMAKIFAKAASRTVPGRLASRTSRVIMTGTSPVRGWHVEHGIDAETRNPITQLHHNGQLSVIMRDLEADDSYPGVYSWITAIVRRQLAKVMHAIGLQRIVSVSTDAILIAVDRPGVRPWLTNGVHPHDADGKQHAAALVAFAEAITPGIHWSVKGIYQQVHLSSPQHLVVDDHRRLSGVPASAVQVKPQVYRYLTWPRLTSHLAAGAGDVYTRRWQQADLTRLTVPRWMYTCGCTRAPQVHPDHVQEPVILPVDVPYCLDHGAPLTERQHPALRRT